METNEEKHEFIVEFSRNISQLDIDNERDNINDNNIKEIEKIEEIEEENIRGRCRSSDSGSGSVEEQTMAIRMKRLHNFRLQFLLIFYNTLNLYMNFSCDKFIP
ncbi:uncharacterized protein OCT59_003400 [Rhizophagus irregularis]|uniref:Uncharacterized protein n=1 Tax=Rhizophagus irregularis (strain DAOM 181602 / DAOM 197198 / MUCL 43194) TaxID=747089 RepID=U9TSU6_RHIID|nr:hypothetical protein OCT59_003400 [Rhizophagus irregularis]